MPSLAPLRLIRFGSFELDCRAGELRKHGIRIKLHEKPFQLLLALLEHAGEVVTRRELQERLWPHDTFVEFENGLNNAVSRLREALRDTADNPRFIETVPRHGYRFLAEVSQASPSFSIAGRFKLWLLVTALTLGTAFALGAFFHLALPPHRAIQSLAVLPFRGLSPGEQDYYFAAGMTDALTTELAKLGVSKVTSETSVERFQNTKESIPQIARTLGVDAVVEGTVTLDGDRVRITVRLIRGDNDRDMWSQSYERQLTNILALQDQVALGVANAIELKLSPDSVAGLHAPKHVNPAAYKAYLEGHYYMQERSPDALPRAKDFFQQAIQLDPSYAPAYSGLSDYYALAETLPPQEALSQARSYAQHSLQLDATLPDGHVSLAYIYFYFDWNWPAADQEFRKAIALAPGLAFSHRWYAVYLAAMGRGSEALAEAQRAEDLDPLAISAHHAEAIAAVSVGQYDRALEEGRKILQLDPNDPRAYADLAVGYFQKQMYQDALENAKKGLELTHRDPFFVSIAAFVQGRLGRLDQAKKLVKEMRAASRARSVPSFYFATAFAGMGQQNQAMDALEKGYNAHDADMVGLNASPWFNPLRSDPRFQGLLRRMNFPHSD